MSNGDEINLGGVSQVASGAGAVNQAGKNTATIHVSGGGDSLSFEKFIQAIKEQIPEDQIESVQAEVLDPLSDIAAEPEPTNQQDALTLKARILDIVEKLEPYAPYVRKTIAAFAEGAMSTIPPPASWVIGGCIEVVRDARRD